MQGIGSKAHGRNVLLARPLVTPQQVYIAAIGLRAALHHHLRQLAGIAKAQIYALAGERVHIMRGVPDESKARQHQTPHALHAQGKRRRRRNHLQVATCAVCRQRNFSGQLAGGQREQLRCMLITG